MNFQINFKKISERIDELQSGDFSNQSNKNNELSNALANGNTTVDKDKYYIKYDKNKD